MSLIDDLIEKRIPVLENLNIQEQSITILKNQFREDLENLKHPEKVDGYDMGFERGRQIGYKEGYREAKICNHEFITVFGPHGTVCKKCGATLGLGDVIDTGKIGGNGILDCPNIT